LRWRRRFGTNRPDAAFALAAGAGGVLVGGAFGATTLGSRCPNSGTAFAAMFDFEGNERWRTTVPHPSGGPSVTTAVAFAADGTPLVVGRGGPNCDSVHTPQRGGRGFVARLSNEGAVLSRKQPGRLIDINGIAVDGAGLYVLGVRDVERPHFGGVVDLVVRLGVRDTVTWARYLRGPRGTNASTMAAVGDGGVVVVGSTNEPGPLPRPTADAIAIGIDADGAIVWRWEVPDSPGYSHATGVGVMGGGVFLGGFAGGKVGGERPFGRGSVWVAKLAVPR
jgi:hypothetical protein